MNILLLTSPPPKISPFSTIEKRPPLGIGYLISVLRNKNHKVYFCDEYLKRSNILEDNFLFEKNIDYVGIYSNTICLQGTLSLIRKIERKRIEGWKGKIMIGGPHTSIGEDDFPDSVDYIVKGEGERAIIKIIEGKVDKRIIEGKKIKNLDDLPRPAWDVFFKLPYDWDHQWIKSYPMVTMNTSRGCPFNCSFCSVCSIWGREYRTMSAQRIFNDIKYLIGKYNIKAVYFREDNFTLNKKRIKEFCKLLIEDDLDIDWICETRVDSLQDFNFVKMMARAGCKAFYIGVESGSPKMLKKMNKQISIKQIEKAFKNAKKAEVKTYASLIYGLPGESRKDRLLTESLLKKIKPDFVGRNIYVGIPGSELYNYIKKNKLYQYEDQNRLLYLKNHNKLVDIIYNGNPNAKIPGTAKKVEIFIFKIKKMKRNLLKIIKKFLLKIGLYDYFRNLKRNFIKL